MEIVGSMIGEGEHLQNEYMCTLLQAYPRKVLGHLRDLMSKNHGEAWDAYLRAARESADGVPRSLLMKEPPLQFTEFNAFGATLWRDFHDDVHWVCAPQGCGSFAQPGTTKALEYKLQANPIQTWSYEKEESKVAEAMVSFDCLIDAASGVMAAPDRNRVIRACRKVAKDKMALLGY